MIPLNSWFAFDPCSKKNQIFVATFGSLGGTHASGGLCKGSMGAIPHNSSEAALLFRILVGRRLENTWDHVAAAGHERFAPRLSPQCGKFLDDRLIVLTIVVFHGSAVM